jgi:hypothetical protein
VPPAKDGSAWSEAGSFDAGHEMKQGLWWMGGHGRHARARCGRTLIVLQFLGLSEMGLATLA